MSTYTGTAGNDKRVGKNTGDSFDMSQGGDDTVLASGGSDAVHMGGTLTAADHISGGAGVDSMELSGDYSHGLVLNATNYDSVERLILDGGNSYDLTITELADINNTIGMTIETVNTRGLGAGDHAYVDASAVTDDVRVFFTGGNGDDSFAGGAADDIFTLFDVGYGGGNDTALGGGGDDRIQFLDGGGVSLVNGGDGDDAVTFDTSDTMSLKQHDTLLGGAGSDTLTIEGTSSRQVSIGGSNFGGFEQLILNMQSCNFQLTSGAASAGADGHFDIDGTHTNQLRIDAGLIRTVALDVTGSQSSNWIAGGHKADLIDVTQGADGDTVFGGAGADVVTINWDNIHATDRFDGGAGADTLEVTGDFSSITSLDPEQITGFERLDFTAAASLVLVNGNIPASGVLTITGADVDGSHLTAGRLVLSEGGRLSGGAGADTITGGLWLGDSTLSGGGGADVITFGGSGNVLTGGAGGDRFVAAPTERLDNGYLGDIADLVNADTIDVSRLDANTTIAGNQAFKLVSAFTHHAGELAVVAPEGSQLTVIEMDTDGDGSADWRIQADGLHAGFDHFVL